MSWEDIIKNDIKHESREAMDELSTNLNDAMQSYSKLIRSISSTPLATDASAGNLRMLNTEAAELVMALSEAIRAKTNFNRALLRQEDMA